MAHHCYVVYTRPVAGQEDEFNDWYDNQHLQDLLKIPGVVRAQRFSTEIDGQRQYLALYDLDTDDVEACLEDIRSRSGTDRMVMSPALDMDSISDVAFAAIGPALTAPDVASAV
jgi:hypothetical protein